MEDDTEVVEVKSRRQILEEAWDKSEEKDEGAEVSKEHTSGKLESELSGESGTPDQSGEKSSKEVEGKEKKPDETTQQELKASRKIETGKAAPAAPLQVDPTDKAPVSWKPAIRELWANVPPEARAEIKRREQEIERTLNETGVMRRFATDFAQMVQPYQHIIRAQNSTPLQAVDNLMKTAASLATGSPQQKAATIGQIISNYGIDVKELDTYLSQNYNPQTAQFNQQQNQAPPQWAMPMFDWMNRVQQNQQQFEQQQRMQAEQEIQQMQEKPYFEDLRNDVADLMEIAARNGKILTIQQAYDKALQLDPEISKIVNQRKAAEATKNPGANLAKARKASKTVVGAPRGDGKSTDKPKTRKEMLSEAWDEASQ